MRVYFFVFHGPRCSLDSCPEHSRGPRQEGHKQNREIKPKRLEVLEFGGEVALEIVFDDENAEKIGIASGAQDVPGESAQAKGRDCGGMKEAEGLAPALGEKRPEKKGAAGEKDGRGALCGGGEGEGKTE